MQFDLLKRATPELLNAYFACTAGESTPYAFAW